MTEVQERPSNSLNLSTGQAAKIALWVAISLILAIALAIALASPVMTAFGMAAL